MPTIQLYQEFRRCYIFKFFFVQTFLGFNRRHLVTQEKDYHLLH